MDIDNNNTENRQSGTVDKPTVFISYSHKDEAWKDKLKPQLEVLVQLGRINVWDDRKINAGDTWYDEIKSAIEEAAISVCLISDNYLASDFCVKEEVPFLLSRKKKEGMAIIPVLLHQCLWEEIDWIEKTQMIPLDGKSVAEDFKEDYHIPFKQVAKSVSERIKNPEFKIPARTTLWQNIPVAFIDIDRLPVTGAELFGRKEELKFLDEAWKSGTTNVISFVAWGGVGKSTLINKWLESMKADNYRGAKRVFGWSFYSQGTGEKVISADLFIKEALKFFEDPTPEEGSPWDKGQRLADLIKNEKTLLVLDGLEPLQADHDFEKGKIKDPSLSVLMEELAKENPGLLIITTREDIPELNEFKETTVQQNLEQISPEAGRALLRTAGVRGTDKELEDASRTFGNQALALRLLGSYLYGEDGHLISHIEKIPDLVDVPEEKGRHPRRVIKASEARFGEGPEVEFLRILGLFDRPAELGAIDALLRGKTISHLTKQLRKLGEAGQKDLISKLRDLNLVAKVGRHDVGKIDCHPLLREHFGEQLKTTYPEAWRDGNSRLYEYYKKQAPELPNTIEEMTPLFYAVAHGCAAERYLVALNEVFWHRIRRGREMFAMMTLGAVGANLCCCLHFYEFTSHISEDVLINNYKGFVLNEAGLCLLALGRLSEAARAMESALDIRISEKDWQNSATNTNNLSELFLTMGEVKKAIMYAQKSVEYSDKSGDTFWIMASRTTFADACHQSGKFKEAENLFCLAEDILIKSKSEIQYLFSLWGFRYHDILFDKGMYDEIIKRSRNTMECAKQNKSLLDVALENLSLGHAYLLRAVNSISEDYSKVDMHLNKSVEGLRKASHQDFLSRGLLARVELYRIKKEFPKARHDLDEAFKIATRGEMGLHKADCHLQYTRLYLAEGDKEKAKEHLATAQQMIDEMGYHRRDVEVLLINARIALTDDDKTTAHEHLAAAKHIIDEKGLHGWDWEVRELETMLGGVAG